MDIEVLEDKMLKIKTNGRDDTNSNFINYPYEPTPYKVLEVLRDSSYIKKNDLLIDYGSGKGRVDFYLSYYIKALTIGIEYDNRLYLKSLKNKETALSNSKVEFININALNYKFPLNAKFAYFFNPFSVSVLDKVIHNIKRSKEENLRDIILFFYYPSTQYIEYFNKHKEIKEIDRLDTSIYFPNDLREYILVMKI